MAKTIRFESFYVETLAETGKVTFLGNLFPYSQNSQNQNLTQEMMRRILTKAGVKDVAGMAEEDLPGKYLEVMEDQFKVDPQIPDYFPRGCWIVSPWSARGQMHQGIKSPDTLKPEEQVRHAVLHMACKIDAAVPISAKLSPKGVLFDTRYPNIYNGDDVFSNKDRKNVVSCLVRLKNPFIRQQDAAAEQSQLAEAA